MPRSHLGIVLHTGFKMDLPDESPYQRIEEMALTAERLGYEYAFSYDHLLSYPDPSFPILEPWTVMPALARATRRIRLGTLVSCAAFRSPIQLAKIATTMDVISEGRTELGIGAGWYETEFARSGNENFGVRAQLFDEYIQVLNGLLSGAEVDFDGRFFKMRSARILPTPTQDSIPVWVGATKPMMLRTIAKHANRWNLRGTPEYCKTERELLNSYLEKQGRRTDSVTDSVYLQVFYDKNRQNAMEYMRKALSPTQDLPTRVAGAIRNPSRVVDFIKLKSGMMGTDHPVASNVVGDGEDCVRALSEYAQIGVKYMFLYLAEIDTPAQLETFTDDVAQKL